MTGQISNTIIDSHIHILPPGRTRGLVRWVNKIFPGHPSREDMTPEVILGDLRACGVETFFNLVFPLREEETEDLNRFSRDIASEYEDIIGFGSLHAETPAKDEVTERCLVEYGLAGMKLHPYVQLFEAFSPTFEPMYRKLAEFRKPFVVHTGFDIFYQQTQDLEYLRGILERHPEMPVVLVHALFPRFRICYELMGEYPQLYLDMTNSVSAVRWYKEKSGAWADAGEWHELERNLEYFDPLLERFSGRIMFGTDHPAGMGTPEQIYADLEWLGLSPEVNEDLLGRTASTFLEKRCRPA
jgi:hypothetical protein